MSAKLQVALDDITLDQALELLGQVRKDIDIAEVGTPFIMEYGMDAVREIKNNFPDLEVLCDAKIMDAGAFEAEIAFRAGADYVTVLGVTDDSTIKSCIHEAGKKGKKVVVDMLCVSDLQKRIETVEALGADVIAVHTGVDQQLAGRTPLDDLREMRKYAKRAAVAVAGGVNETTVEEYLKYKPEIIIVGNGIVKAQNPAETAKLLGKYVHRQEMI